MAGGMNIMSGVMTVIQILGLALTALLLKRLTTFPFWVCFLLSVPTFFLLFWGSLLILCKGRRPGGKG